MAPGGYLIVAAENSFVYARMAWMNQPLAPGEERNRITRSRLHALIAYHGLEILKSYSALPGGTRRCCGSSIRG